MESGGASWQHAAPHAVRRDLNLGSTGGSNPAHHSRVLRVSHVLWEDHSDEHRASNQLWAKQNAPLV